MLFPVPPSVAFEIPDAEYARLLGVPRSRGLDGPSAERAKWAREWYAAHGRPWAAARLIEVVGLHPDSVSLAGDVLLKAPALRARLQAGDAKSLAVVGVTAGGEVDEEGARLWASDRPDEAFFVDRIGAAVAEHLVRWASMTLCRNASVERLTALPALSPGCADWDFADQKTLYGLLDATGPLALLESGMLTPKSSMLAAVGLTPHALASSAEDLCRACDLTPCSFRRAPHHSVRALGRRPVRRAEVAR